MVTEKGLWRKTNKDRYRNIGGETIVRKCKRDFSFLRVLRERWLQTFCPRRVPLVRELSCPQPRIVLSANRLSVN